MAGWSGKFAFGVVCGAVFQLIPFENALAQDSSVRGARDSQPNVLMPQRPLENPVPPPSQAELRAAPGGVSAASAVVRGRFTSVQVNVDAAGNNLLGDASNESSLAIDPTNSDRMAIGWRHFSTITSSFRQAGIAYSEDGGLSWSSPPNSVLDFGQFRSDPVLASDRNGVFYYSSLSSLSSIEVFTSFDGGATWPRLTPAFGGDKQWFAVDKTDGIGSGNLYQLWNSQFSCCAGTDFTRSVDGGATFEAPIQMPAVPGMPFARPKWGTMDVGLDGTLCVVGATLDQTSHVFLRSSTAKDPSVVPGFELSRLIDLGGSTTIGLSPNPSGLMGQVWVATDHSQSPTRGNVYVLGSVDPPGTEPLDVHFIRSSDGGNTWSAPVRVNDDGVGLRAIQWFGTMSVAPNGRIDVVWNDTRGDTIPSNPSFSELYYSFSLDGGLTWSVNEPVTPPFEHGLGYPQQDKLGDYYHMVSDNAAGNLAFAATFNGEQDVFFVRVTPDCNGNGVPDETDILNGTSEDCNGNLTPDECEPTTDCNMNAVRDICEVVINPTIDCNFNGVPDDCDIADGTAVDSNGNGIPDSCECDVDPVVADASPVLKSRYLSFTPGNAGRRVAFKVTLAASDIFPGLVGTSWWVGPPSEHVESLDAGTTFTAAGLRCTQVFHDWTTVGLLHVFGDAVIPESRYEVRVIREACTRVDPSPFSSPVEVTTTRLGDLVTPFTAMEPVQPDFRDIRAVVSKFLDDPGAVDVAFADIADSVPDQSVDFRDINVEVTSFLGDHYPYGPPTVCGAER